MLNYSTFEAMYHRYEESGLNVRDFCSNEGIHETTFYYWVRKCKQRSLLSPKGFIPLVVSDSSVPADVSKNDLPVRVGFKGITCEVTFPGGGRLKLKGDLSPEHLQSLLHYLSR